MEKILCGCGRVFYADCQSSPRIRELLLQFRFNPSLSNAKTLLNDSEVQTYCDTLANKCPLECPCCKISMKKRITLLHAAERKPGGLCAAALYEKAALMSLGWWK